MNQKETIFSPVNFSTKDKPQNEFFLTLRKRVNGYFKERGISKNGDYRMWIKVIAMPLIYFIPFILILTGTFNNLWQFYGLWLIMGVGVAGCGLGVMHDANHGSLSSNPKVNNLIGKILNVIGGNALNWKIQHNVLHHSFTNVDGYDEDIHPGGLLRFSPHQPHKKFFRFQHIYAWILYGMMTLMWITVKDFAQLARYNKLGLLTGQGKKMSTELVKMIINKVLYYAYVLVLPLLLLDVAWYHIVFGIVSMHFLAGLILGMVFQPAHVVPTSEYPLPDANNHVDANWAVHQLSTTADFAQNNPIVNWYVGGLNFQIEHHLFPNICHVHYKELSKIVKKTADEFGYPYIANPTFFGAVIKHGKMLYQLGRA